MSYTVNKLAKLSGVSVRTLHFYDEIGLLKPAYHGENNYRYYEEPQLLLLQQILFFRQLGFQLRDIQRIISSPDFDKLATLEAHRKVLENQLDQTRDLIETLDKTIAHLRGEEMIKLEEIFHGFDADKQKLYEDFLLDSGVEQEVLDETKKKLKTWSKADWVENKRQGDQLYAELVKALKQGLSPSSEVVQKLIAQHYQLTCEFWTPDRESYIGLSQLYGSHPDFVKFYRDLHPELLGFLAEAMKIYAETELS